MKNEQDMAVMRQKRDAAREAKKLWQAENTHQLAHGYMARPTVLPQGVGWELHPPKGAGGVSGQRVEHRGPIWYVNDLEDAKRKVETHLRYYTGDGKLVQAA